MHRDAVEIHLTSSLFGGGFMREKTRIFEELDRGYVILKSAMLVWCPLEACLRIQA